MELTEEIEVMDEEEARRLFETMLQEREIDRETGFKVQLLDEVVRDFKERTNDSR